MSLIDKILGREDLQKELQEVKIELEGQLKALHEACIVSETDIKGNITYVNDTFCEISKYTREELIGKNHRILKSGLHSDSVYQELWQTISSGKTWKGVIANKAKDGSIYWVASTIVPVLNEKGNPIKYVSVRFDITEQILMRQYAETQLQEIDAQTEEINQINEELSTTNEQLRKTQLLLENQVHALNESAIVSETDIKGNITYANDTFCKISKYSREELIGKNHRILKSGLHPDSVYQELWQTISSGKTWKGVIANKAKDGSIYWVASTIVPVLNEKGNPVKYISIRYDISAEKELQETLNHKDKEVQELIISLNNAKKQLERKVEELQSDTQQSINYAAHIQRAVMPTIPEVQNDFGEEYEIGIFFQPKEAVSGDFYWSARVHDKTIFMLGDASGHGVPGSFLSLMAMNSLEYLVKEKFTIHPDILLTELDKKLRHILRHDKQAGPDRITLNDSIDGYAVLVDGNTISIASSMRGALVVENGKPHQFIGGTKRSIADNSSTNPENFKAKTITLTSGQTLYLASDGFETQLGGVDGHKKYGVSNFIELLNQLQVLPVKKRMEALKRVWSDWKGFFAEQTDDIIVVAIHKK